MLKEVRNEHGEIRRVNITGKASNRWQLTNEGCYLILITTWILATAAASLF